MSSTSRTNLIGQNLESKLLIGQWVGPPPRPILRFSRLHAEILVLLGMVLGVRLGNGDTRGDRV